MRRIKFWFFTIICVCIVVWLLTGEFDAMGNGYFAFRRQALQLTGLVTFCVMTVDMIIACRLAFIENLLNGLDKAYRLHKWLGITALVTAIFHLLLAKGVKWAVGWGWLEKPMRRAATGNMPEKTGIELIFSLWHKNAEVIGEWAFYGVVVLCLVALIKRIPYRYFRHVHIIFAGLYLLLVFHAIALTNFNYWLQPFGMLTFVLAISGTIAAIVLLLKKAGFDRPVNAVVTNETVDEQTGTTCLTLKVSNKWKGQQSGQFAFVTFDKEEGAHPFTIASAWNDKQRLVKFVIKGLGDYTKGLIKRNLIGKKVRLDGPYGRFCFIDDNAHQQIWIGAGIGITPFLAKLEELKNNGNNDHSKIHFIYVTQFVSKENEKKLYELALTTGVDLTIWITPQQGKLNGERLSSMITNWKQAAVWFCGPQPFGQSLHKDLVKHGLRDKYFHRELFDLR